MNQFEFHLVRYSIYSFLYEGHLVQNLEIRTGVYDPVYKSKIGMPTVLNLDNLGKNYLKGFFYQSLDTKITSRSLTNELYK